MGILRCNNLHNLLASYLPCEFFSVLPEALRPRLFWFLNNSISFVFVFLSSKMGNLSCKGRNRGKKKKKHGACQIFDEHRAEDDDLDGQGRDLHVNDSEGPHVSSLPTPDVRDVKVTRLHYKLKRNI